MTPLLFALAACRTEGPITYAEPDGVALTLDVWRPASSGPSPGVLLVHGGGWTFGHLYAGSLERQAAAAAEAGLVAVSVNYRLSQEAVWPAQRDDVACGLRWMRANAEEIGLDPERVAAVGHSAGGHLALSLSEAPEEEPPGWCGHQADGTLQAAVSLAGPSDLPVFFEATTDWGRSVLNDLLGLPRDATPQTDPDAYADASPSSYVDADGPPVLQVAGAEDPLVPAAVAESFDLALEEAGRETALEVWPDAAHGTVNTEEAWLDFVLEQLQR